MSSSDSEPIFMSYQKSVNLVFILLFLHVFSGSEAISQSSQSSGKVKLDVEHFEKRINSAQDVQLIDVRTPQEYKKSHLKDALNVDWNSSEFDNMIKALNKEQPVYLYCLSGSRSASAAEKMRASGFKEVYEMVGGIMAWNGAEKPTVQLAKAAGPEMTLADYNDQLTTTKLVLVDFNAPWCAPCKKMAPMLKEIAEAEKENLKLLKINIEDHKTLAKELDIEVLPTLLLYKGSKIIWQHQGLIDKSSLLEIIQSKQSSF